MEKVEVPSGNLKSPVVFQHINWHFFFRRYSFLALKAKSIEKLLITVQRDVTQSILFIIPQVHSTCFRCQQHPSSGVHKTVIIASGTVQLPPSNVTKLGHVGGR